MNRALLQFLDITGRRYYWRSAPCRYVCQRSSNDAKLFAVTNCTRRQRMISTKDDMNTKIILDPLVVCGVSGVGKGTVIHRFLEVQQLQYEYVQEQALARMEKNRHRKFPNPDLKPKIFVEFVFAISHTTRQPRPKEENGVHYHFTTKERMEQYIQRGNYFAEHATVHNNMYGTSWNAIHIIHDHNQNDNQSTNESGFKVVRKALLDIDVQGVQQLKQIEAQQKAEISATGTTTLPYLLQPKYIFIAPPNLKSLQERLIARGTESTKSLQVRTQNAMKEMYYGCDLLRYAYDSDLSLMYRKSKHFHTVMLNATSVNDTVDEFILCVDRIYSTNMLLSSDMPLKAPTTPIPPTTLQQQYIDFIPRPQHLTANKYEPDLPIDLYEEMMYK